MSLIYLGYFYAWSLFLSTFTERFVIMQTNVAWFQGTWTVLQLDVSVETVSVVKQKLGDPVENYNC